MFDVLADVVPGNKIRVRFKENATEDLIYVLAMERAQVLIVNSSDLMVIQAIQESDDWDGDDNRNFTFEVGPGWSIDFFEGRMRRAVESVEVCA